MSRQVQTADELEIQKMADNFQDVYWVSTVEERNSGFEKADAANMPVIWVETREKYGDVTSDMITVDGYHLSEEARDDKLESLVNQWFGKTIRLSKPHHKNDVTAFIGQVTNGIQGLHIRHVPQFTEGLAKILFDNNNWVKTRL